MAGGNGINGRFISGLEEEESLEALLKVAKRQTDVPEATEAPEVPKATQAPEVPEATEAPDETTDGEPEEDQGSTPKPVVTGDNK